jgi:hypothetical protein
MAAILAVAAAATNCNTDLSDLNRGSGKGNLAGTAGAASSGGAVGVDASSGAAGSGGIDASRASGGAAGKGAGGEDASDASASGGAGGIAGASGSGGSNMGGTAGSGGVSGTAGASGTGGASGSGGSTDGDGSITVDAGGSGGAIDVALDLPPTDAVFSVGSFVKSNTTGSQVVPHALGQVPKALILWTAGKTSETLSAGFYYGIGVSDGTTSGAIAMSTRDGTTASSSSRRIAPKAITLVQAGEITVAEADLTSLGSSSVTLSWTTNDNQPYVIHYLAIGGPEVTAKVVNWQTPTTTGMKAVTDVGFKPEAVLHFHVGAAVVTAPPVSQSNGVIGMGVMNRAGSEWSVQIADATSSSPSVATRAQRTDAAIYMYHAPWPVINKMASFVSMDPKGFTLNFTTATTDASQVYSLALTGLQSSVGTFNKTTLAAPAIQAVATSFQPGAVLLSSYQIGAQTAAVRESQASWGIGVSDGTNEASSAIVTADGVSPTVVDAVDKTSKAFLKMSNAPLDAEADMASFDPDGFTLSWTTSDSVASQMCFLALGAR